MFRVWFAVFCTLWCALSWSLPASAADSAATFAKAIELFTTEKYQEALPLFREAHQASGSPNARIYVARCLLEIGEVPQAYEEMKATVSDATARAETEDKYVPTRDSAAAELALLERRVGKLVVAITNPPDGTAVQVNGRELPAERLGVPVAVLPGKVTVVVRAAGKEPVDREIDVPAGQTRSLALTLQDQAEGGDPEPPPVAPDGPDQAEGGGLRIAGYVVAGVGLVGIGVFAITASMAKSDFDELDEECGGVTCPASEQGRIDDGRTLNTVANVSLIAGSVVLAGGVALIIFGGPSDPEETTSAGLTMAPLIGPDTGGLTVVGRF